MATSDHAVADSDGTVHVPGFDLPLSIYISAEAKRSLVEQLRAPQFDPNAVTADKVAALRESVNTYLAPMLKRMEERYPVDIGQQVFGQIHAHTVIPKKGIAAPNRDRVLINLHGGGFMVGDSGTIGLLESIPIAALSQIQVIPIDYRQGPEYQFPAASEDVTAVYRELLNRFVPQNIGIYGCSAGGLLAAEATAWIQNKHLPRPGAIGVLCASADARWAGDAYFTVPALTGRPPPSPGAPPNYDEKYYYGDNDLTSPLMSPVTSPAMLANFPPTLIVTATRAGELSAAVHTDTELIKAGATAELHVWDGMWHGFFMDPDLPESQEAYNVIVKFFQGHLGHALSK
jgi:monoterpene epsilon-lactone hydrolase